MRIRIKHRDVRVLNISAEPGGDVIIEGPAARRSVDLRQILALAIVTLAERVQLTTGQPIDEATVDIASWMDAALRSRRKRRRKPALGCAPRHGTVLSRR